MKNPKVFGEVSLTCTCTHTHTLTHTCTRAHTHARAYTRFFLFPSSHQNHLSEQNRGSLRVVSLFGATNKSSRALHQMNSPLDWRLHKGLLTLCVRACFSGNGSWLNTSILTSPGEEKWLKLEEKGGLLSNFFHFTICQCIQRYRGFYESVSVQVQETLKPTKS